MFLSLILITGQLNSIHFKIKANKVRLVSLTYCEIAMLRVVRRVKTDINYIHF